MSFPYSHIVSMFGEEGGRGQLFLSGVGMVGKGELLAALGVGAVLSVMDPWAYAHYKVGEKVEHLQLRHQWVQVEDDEGSSLLPLLPATNAFLLAELPKHNVLVHCQAGVSRSPAVVIAFLMHHHRLSYAQAKDLVKKKRNCIEPNKGFEKQLMALPSSSEAEQ